MLTIALVLVLLASMLFELQCISFAKATYTIHQNHTLISIQSPNGSYVESSIALIVNVSLIYGTTSTVDEFSFQNLTCSYSLDNGEWKNITSMNITSNTAGPDINYWYGLLHRLNITYNTVMQNLSAGLHSLNVALKSTDSWGIYQNTSQTYFTVNTQPTPTPNTSSTFSSTLSPSPSVPEFPSWIILLFAIATTLMAIMTIKRKKRGNCFV